MNEPLEQSMAGETGQEQSLELANRLLRRRTEPVGVINTHHPQQMYDRTAGLVARRFTMLDHWRTRYASGENSAASNSDVGGDFALASAPLAALREKVAAAPPRSVTPGSSAQTSAQVPTQASPTAASPMMRVMRRQRRQSCENPDASSGAAGRSADLTAHTKTVEVIAPTSVKGRVVDAAATAIRPPLPLQSIPPATAARAQRKADEVPGLLKRLPLASALIQRQAAPGETRGPSSGGTHAQSREDRIDNSAVASAPQTPGGKPAVAAEIPNPSSAQAPPKIVWRKGAENSSTASLLQSAKRENITPGAPMIARQNESGSNQTAETFTPASSPSPSDSGGGGVDVEQLAEQVSRLLARQLQIERERRGMF